MPTDDFRENASSVSDPARRHFAITPSDSNDLAVLPKAIYVNAGGNVVIVDETGTAITYAVSAGDLLPIRAVRVRATGTTATVVGWA